MTQIALQEVSAENWRAALALGVQPDQQRFVADCVPIAAIALAKAYIRPGGLVWVPYAIAADQTIVGLIELAYEPNSVDRYWIYHFFIDARYQGKGYGTAALRAFVRLVWATHTRCKQINLTVHPENHQARRVYTGVGFRPAGREVDGEPVYMLPIGEIA
jgi:diamine N-acetyltransferase